MPQYPIPPWLQPPPNRGAQYLAGYQIRNQMAQANADRSLRSRALNQQAANAEAARQIQRRQLQQQMQMAQMREQLAAEELRQRQERTERDLEIRKQTAEISKAYQESMVSLRKAEAEEKQRMNNENIKNVARRYAAMQEYQKAMSAAKQKDFARIAMTYAPALSSTGTMSGSLMTAAQKASEPPFIPTYRDVGGRRMWREEPNRWTLERPQSLASVVHQQKVIADRIKDLETEFTPGALYSEKEPAQWDPMRLEGLRRAKTEAGTLRGESEKLRSMFMQQPGTTSNRWKVERDEKGNLVLPQDLILPDEASTSEGPSEEEEPVYESGTEETEPEPVYP